MYLHVSPRISMPKRCMEKLKLPRKIQCNKAYNHNHRPCRWFALAPLGPIASRAYRYRLIEFSFACVSCPTTADAVIYASKAPLCKGSCQPNGWLRDCHYESNPSEQNQRFCPPPLTQGRLSAAVGLGKAKAFWNHRHRRWFSLCNKEPTVHHRSVLLV